MTRNNISTQWDLDNRNAINDNFKNLFDDFNNVVEVVSEKAYGEVVDAAKLNWKEPVNSYSDLPSEASEGDTRFDRETGRVYRFNGSEWIEIQQIDASAINEVDQRLTSQLAQKANKDEVNELATNKADKDEFQDYRDATGFSLEAIIRQFNLEPIPDPIYIENLWDIENTILATINEDNGNVNDHHVNRLSEFISIKRNTNYSFISERMSKIVFFDEEENYIEGYGWLEADKKHTYTTPDNAAFVRLNITAQEAVDPADYYVMFVVGEEIPEELDPDDPPVWDGDFWGNVPSPPLKQDSVRNRHVQQKSITSDKLSDELMRMIREGTDSARPLQPFPKTLNFKEISTGWQEVNHLSQDGEVVYFKRGYNVEQSLDDGETIQQVGAPNPDVPSIQAVRDLADGELLVSTTRDEDNNLKSKVYKSRGYDRHNPEDTEFEEVLEAISSQANIYASWGLETHDNICLASEYGLRGEDGARHVYLSTDYGETWEMIFDQKTYVEDVEGAPKWTDSAHLHTVHYDRYWQRIWLAVGDNPNTATYYSDDLGQTWKYVPDSGVVQYTGILSFPDGVIFGSDRAPNGLHVWRRTENKEDTVVIETLKTINDNTNITHVFQRPFRRYAEKGEVALFPATRISDYQGQYGSVIMGFTGINNPYLLYELPSDHAGLGFYNVVGVTAKGNILTSHSNGINHSILRAKAPVWE